MSRELGLTHDWPVVIVGAGNLGQALANYAGFDERGFPVAAVVDIDPAKVGTTIGNVPVRHIDELPSLVATEAASGSSPRRPERLRARRTGSSAPA